ncbi:undecaprenyldiphospho-muramoylpentapeptide beta-N-acetylglucosaminyltransferase [bacterium]|nr:undecaprenyldiphospho-muramoylpentapeptide beta-N-acetylglucosaminyltransferase [bacterium]
MFAGGGTGGHVYPALAVAEEILQRQPGTEVLFVGGTKGNERRIVARWGYPFEGLPVMGMPRKLSPALAGFAWKLGVSILRSRRLLRAFRPTVVMATGGYVSGPPMIAAWSLGIPFVIQEQNSFPGVTNRKLARFADIVFLGFEDAVPSFNGKAETVVTGNPVRKGIDVAQRENSARFFGLDPSKKTVLVFGGSQGSRAINRAFSEIVDSLADRDIQVIWQTGDLGHEIYSDYDGRSGGRIRVLAYIDTMEQAYAAADLVVARAGAMSIAEITACGIPALFIPLPTAAANHQEHNARALVRAGAASMILERDLTSQVLAQEILGIVMSGERLGAMSEASKKFGKKDAAGDIAGIIIERYGSN